MGMSIHRSERLLSVDPQGIRRVILRNRNYDKKQDLGRVIGGDWDRRVHPFNRMDVWKAFVQHFVHGLACNQTRYYKRVMKSLSNGRVNWGCRTRAEFDARCHGLDALYERIKSDGFRQQSVLNDTHYDCDDVSICIDRHGRMLFEDGQHRL